MSENRAAVGSTVTVVIVEWHDLSDLLASHTFVFSGRVEFGEAADRAWAMVVEDELYENREEISNAVSNGATLEQATKDVTPVRGEWDETVIYREVK